MFKPNVYYTRQRSKTFNSSTFGLQRAFMCFVYTSEQTPTFTLYSINWLVTITEMESVYCAVRTGPSTKTYVSSLKSYLSSICPSVSR